MYHEFMKEKAILNNCRTHTDTRIHTVLTYAGVYLVIYITFVLVDVVSAGDTYR